MSVDIESLGRGVVQMTIDDALHFTEAEREEIKRKYPKHEHPARLYGIPMMGEGLIYPFAREDIEVAPFQIPNYFARIAGVDFGAAHATACVWLAHDRDLDIVYAIDCYKKAGDHSMLPAHAAAIKLRGDWIPVAWPHDGDNETGVGPSYRKQYLIQGVKFLPERSTDSAGSNRVEPMIQEIHDRMQVGKFKIFSTLTPLFTELALYARKDGKIVKTNDDALDAMRTAYMSLRHAKTKPAARDNAPPMMYSGPRNSITGV